jgi:hypothetical protein
MAAKSRPRVLSNGWFWASLVLILVALGIFFRGQMKQKPDPAVFFELNGIGVGFMDQFEFKKAVHAFERVVQLDPDWTPGRINLGIALLNTAVPANLQRALGIFADILRKEPDNPYAHFCTGIIYDYQGQVEDAIPHFEAVTKKDPNDAAAWFFLGKQYEGGRGDTERALPCFRRAVELDPYLNAAIYALAMKEEGEAKLSLLDRHGRLEAANWNTPTGNKHRHTEMGYYAEVIGRPAVPQAVPACPLPLFAPSDKFRVQLAPGARWATRDDVAKSANGELRALVRARFGGTQVVLDYNGDDRPDLWLLGAVVDECGLRDLLLRNDGLGNFTDVTAEAGLAASRTNLGCCVGDFDNDGRPDLLLTGVGRVWLFRNVAGRRFEDVTQTAGLHKLTGICLGAAFVDLDQDGDLDLLVARYADNPENAVRLLKGENGPSGGGLAIWLNVGEAPAARPTEDPPPNKPLFRALTPSPEWSGEAASLTSILAADLDLDRDLDLLLLADNTSAGVVWNDRLLTFHRSAVPAGLVPLGRWNGALVFDANRDERSDLFFVGPGQPPVLLVNQNVPAPAAFDRRFKPGSVKSPPLLQATAADLDLDGQTDIVGLSKERKPILLHNDGGRLKQAFEALGADADWPQDLCAVNVADFDGDGLPDILVWSEANGIGLHVNRGNGNHGVQVALTGHRRKEAGGGIVRCNADGVGVWVQAHAGDLQSCAEYTALSAGLGQGRLPLLLGLGPRDQADVLRLRWPDNCWQAEFDLPAEQIRKIAETNRKGESCPVLFTWDGQRFVFVTDFLGEGSMGEMLAGGGHRSPRPEETVKIEADQLVPLKGQYVLKIAEPMDEATYLDRLQLVALDHPPDVHVYPDERFASGGPPPTQELLAFRQTIFPVRATDHRGKDVTATLRWRDRDTVSDYALRSWLGFAEEHWVELDLGDRLAKFGPNDRLILCLAGWTDYPYPESIWAAQQAGIELQPPLLERPGDDGQWQVVAEAGFPAGLPRVMTLDVSGKLGGPNCRLRLRTNMQVFWDQIYVAPLLETVEPGKAGTVRATCLEVASARLSARGCMQEHSPDGRQPTVYDYDRLEAVPVSRLAGRLTRFGDVTELLRGLDDRFAIFGPGDELDVRFAAQALPELPPGWKRSFVLRTWGYCKDCSPFTASGDTVGPLPFRGMRDYPYGPGEQFPQPDYDRRFNTRRVGAR